MKIILIGVLLFHCAVVAANKRESSETYFIKSGQVWKKAEKGQPEMKVSNAAHVIDKFSLSPDKAHLAFQEDLGKRQNPRCAEDCDDEQITRHSISFLNLASKKIVGGIQEPKFAELHFGCWANPSIFTYETGDGSVNFYIYDLKAKKVMECMTDDAFKNPEHAAICYKLVEGGYCRNRS